jgi:hypothetical protein
MSKNKKNRNPNMGNVVENQPVIPENVSKQPEIEESKDITDQESKEIVEEIDPNLWKPETIKRDPISFSDITQPVKKDRVSFSEMLRNRRKTKS